MSTVVEAPREHSYSRSEELANTLSAAAGLILSAGFSPFVILRALRSPQPWGLSSAAIFLGSLLTVYLASMVYHALAPGRLKRAIRLIDHSAIFVLIAGTYTPFALGPLASSGGAALAIIEWTLAAMGIAFKLAGGIRYRTLSNVLYLLMGWLGIFWVRPFIENATWPGFLWVLVGGVAYSVGILFYAAKGKLYSHLVWHLFILAGSFCHIIAVSRYAL